MPSAAVLALGKHPIPVGKSARFLDINHLRVFSGDVNERFLRETVEQTSITLTDGSGRVVDI